MHTWSFCTKQVPSAQRRCFIHFAAATALILLAWVPAAIMHAHVAASYARDTALATQKVEDLGGAFVEIDVRGWELVRRGRHGY